MKLPAWRHCTDHLSPELKPVTIGQAGIQVLQGKMLGASNCFPGNVTTT
jgi:hypothetical protein